MTIAAARGQHSTATHTHNQQQLTLLMSELFLDPRKTRRTCFLCESVKQRDPCETEKLLTGEHPAQLYASACAQLVGLSFPSSLSGWTHSSTWRNPRNDHLVKHTQPFPLKPCSLGSLCYCLARHTGQIRLQQLRGRFVCSTQNSNKSRSHPDSIQSHKASSVHLSLLHVISWVWSLYMQVNTDHRKMLSSLFKQLHSNRVHWTQYIFSFWARYCNCPDVLCKDKHLTSGDFL